MPDLDDSGGIALPISQHESCITALNLANVALSHLSITAVMKICRDLRRQWYCPLTGIEIYRRRRTLTDTPSLPSTLNLQHTFASLLLLLLGIL